MHSVKHRSAWIGFLLATLWLSQVSAAPPQVGDIAFAISGRDGQQQPVEFDPASRNKPAVLLFWATWCPYCKALMPHLQSVRDLVGRDRLDIYAIDIAEDADADPVAVLRQRGLDFTLIRDGDAIAEQYGVRGTPMLYLVGDDGRIRYLRPNGDSPAATEARLIELLAEPGQ